MGDGESGKPRPGRQLPSARLTGAVGVDDDDDDGDTAVGAGALVGGVVGELQL